MLSTFPLSVAASNPFTEPYVLIVDDHEPTLSGLQTVIEASGYRCVSTSSAADALVISDARRPAVVVTDLSMPRLDGQGLARWLKSRYPSVPIILVTGEALDAPAELTLRRTFAAVLAKPLNVEPFLFLIGELMPRTIRLPRT